MSLLSVANLAFAHPGHVEGTGFFDALKAGLIHPFTGADHMMLAIGMGMLMLRYRHSFLGWGSLLAGLIIGFVLAVSGGLDQFPSVEEFVEHGITASVILVTIVLFSKKLSDTQKPVVSWIAPISLMILAMFHGAAHGLEVPTELQADGFFCGMIISMSILFGIGTVIMRFIKNRGKDNPIYQRVLAALGLTAVFLS